MGVPQLEYCCCGCTLRTGTKIIGWLSLIGSIIMLIVMSVGLATLYYIEKNPDKDVTPETKDIREHLPAMKALTIFLIFVHLIGSGLALVLLMGAYQNKAKLVLAWVMIALTTVLVEQALNIAQMITLFHPQSLVTFVFFLIELYFILVVYSFYREIKNVATNYS